MPLIGMGVDIMLSDMTPEMIYLYQIRSKKKLNEYKRKFLYWYKYEWVIVSRVEVNTVTRYPHTTLSYSMWPLSFSFHMPTMLPPRRLTRKR